jgi:hypothetical protein
VSQQEWIRQVLRRTANRLSSAELVAQRNAITPMADPEFDEVRKTIARRRRTALEHLDAGRRRRCRRSTRTRWAPAWRVHAVDEILALDASSLLLAEYVSVRHEGSRPQGLALTSA